MQWEEVEAAAVAAVAGMYAATEVILVTGTRHVVRDWLWGTWYDGAAATGAARVYVGMPSFSEPPSASR